MMVSLGFIFLAALVFDAIGRRTMLPRVTLLLVFGFSIGPAGFDLLPDITAKWFPAVTDLALVMIGFLLGGVLTLRDLRERGRQVLVFSAAVVVVTFGIVGAGLFALGAPAAVALLLGAIATATAPAASADVVHESRVDSPFSRTLKAIVAVDDAWCLILFSTSFALSLLLQGDGAAAVLLHALWEL